MSSLLLALSRPTWRKTRFRYIFSKKIRTLKEKRLYLIAHQASDLPSPLLADSLGHAAGGDLPRLRHDDVDELPLHGVLVQEVLWDLGAFPATRRPANDDDLVTVDCGQDLLL